ncbi:MAG TPA: M24 family metallopeptidase [Burkholderiales bacterium]|nr:M24 family metallopeptidase [Burkholderiales bacterium]
MAQADERINTPISTAELERRWAAVRAAMAERGIDVLLMQANNDFMGGYVKYFTDVPATNGYCATVVFPRDERMSVIGQGPHGQVREFPREGDALRRGVARFMSTPSYASCPYTAGYDAALAERALAPYAGATVGLLGTAAISFALIDHLQRGALAKAKFVDASDMVDRIKAVKSAEEIALMRRTAALQDAAMDAVLHAIKPGMRDIEVAAIAEQVGHAHGSEQGLFLCASGPVGAAAVFGNRHLQNRVIRAGDYFTLLIENNGPGGYYTELGRTCVLGRASQEMRDEYEFVLRAQRFTLDLLKPGASCPDIWERYNAFLRENARPEEKRLHCHSQGYDMVERPLVRFDEPMPVGASMVFSCHPTYVTERTYSWICDNFLIDANGSVEHLHRCPQRIFELG